MTQSESSLKPNYGVDVASHPKGYQLTKHGVTLISPTSNFVAFGLQHFENKFERCFKIEKGDVCLDVGACIGDTTIPMLMKTGRKGKVIAIEPEPINLEYLKLNTYPYPNVQIIGKAAFNKQATMNLHSVEAVTSHSLIYKDNRPYYIEVETDTLDNMLDGELIDYAKIDVQHAEPEVLEGSPKFFASVKKLVVFVHDRGTSKSTFPRLMRLFMQNGEFNVHFFQDTSTLHAWRN